MGYNKQAGEQLPATELNSFYSSAGLYGSSAIGTDAYAITVTPVPNDYDDGDKYTFKADVANTGTATLNVNGLGAKTIKKLYNQTLNDGDIRAGQIVTVVYDSANSCFQLQTAHTALSRKIYITTSEITFTNGNGGAGAGVEQTLLSTTITGGTLGNNEAVRFKLYFRDCNFAAAASSWILKVKYGGATQLTMDSRTSNNDLLTLSGYLEGYIIGNASSSVQKLTAEALFLDTNTGTAEADNDASVGMDKQHMFDNAAGAINSATDQTLIITLTQTNSTSNDCVFEWGIVEKV